MPRLTDKKIIRSLWLILAFVFPFFAVRILRFNNQTFKTHLAIPMLVISIILFFVFIMLLMQRKIIKKKLFNYNLWKFLLFLFCLFFCGHLIGLIKAHDQIWAIRETIKLGVGIISFLCLITFFPSEQNFIKKFWTIVIWTSTTLLIFLIYKYAFVFKSSYLGIQLQQDRAGRNQLTWYLILIFPYVISYFLYSRKKIITCIPLFIFTTALIYAASRGAWISTLVGILALFFMLNKMNQNKGAIKFIFLTSLFILISLLILINFVNITEFDFTQRFNSLFNPSEEISSSYYQRLFVLKQGLYYFLLSPILGVGLTNSILFLEIVTHNDYLAVFLELGFLVGLCFIGILIIIAKIINKERIPHYKKDIIWISLATRAAFISLCVSLIFINAYTSLLFWIFLGLALVITENERRLNKFNKICVD